MIRVNISKARNIKREELRAERKPILEALDIEYMRASEAQDIKKMNEITAKKQALRDCTKHPSIESASTTEDLKAISLVNLV